MGKFAVGEVVLVSFPFSNLQGQKKRPALVIAKAEFGNLILCQITSKPYASKLAKKIDQNSFKKGKLPVVSYVRPDKLFTADLSIISKSTGELKTNATASILSSVRALFTI
ncbi:hypothetical protein A3G14_02640 [Candidatus Curtissbacteria bacterium RIFCSPLOWO2_12_FULL_38_9]|uniref:Growth inhibitor PemK n=1 Tax=Candidatus Curtissbacteria bacterium RIFCSPLOWO2_12_FULL_38_9 TaxID=1797735 RepID=A0A1F5IAB3_9BACT|nr:MAG: hypothetical protein A3G14_02640 [Candidatus Curtissbacteria bacterium RIFCSPLOWO2_12_FULL_38_9]